MNTWSLANQAFPTFMRVKNRWSIVLLFCFLSLAAQAQEVSLPRAFLDEPISELLKVIKKHHDARLAYDVSSLRVIDRSVTLQGESLENDLNILLDGSGYTFKLLKNTYLIVPLPRKVESDLKVLKRNISLQGRVKDLLSNEVLPFASISVLGTSIGTSTQMDGSFFLNEIPTDTLSICASYLGYRSLCFQLQSLNLEKTLPFYLERNNTFLPAVEIKGSKEKGVRILEKGQLIELDPAMLERITVNGQADLFKAVQFLPGISSGDGLDASLNIRGSEEDENLILWDGFKIYHQNHFFGVFSTLNPEAIRNIQVHKGAYPSRYGGRSGGVLEVTGRSGDVKNGHVHAGVDLIGMNLGVESPLSKKTSILVNMRRSHSDFLNTPLYEQLLERVFEQSVAQDPAFTLNLSKTHPKFFYYDLNVKVHIELSEHDQVNFSLFNGRDFFSNESHNQYASIDGSPRILNDYYFDDSSWGNTGLGATWDHNMKAGRHMYSSIGFSDYSSSYFFSEEQRDYLNGNPLVPKFNSTLQDNEVKDLSLEHRQVFPQEKGKLEVGYALDHLELNYGFLDQNLIDGVTFLKDSLVRTNNHSLYADRDWTWNDRLELDVGMRATMNTYTNRLYCEPRVLLSYKASEEISFRTGGGNYVQMIRRTAEQNLFLRQPDRWVLSNGDKLPESRTFQGILGGHWEKGPWQIDAEGFYKKISGSLLNQEQIRFLSAYTADNKGLVTGNAQVVGLDLYLSYSKGPHDLWLAYSYTASFNRFSEINEGREFPSVFNKPHDFKAVYSYAYRDYILSTDLIYSTGYSYTPLLGTFQNELTGQDFVVYGDDLSARLPDFFRWDMSIQRAFYAERTSWVIGVGIYNLTDHRNVRTRRYSVEQVRPDSAEELTIRAVDLELLGLTPNFILKFSFQ